MPTRSLRSACLLLFIFVSACAVMPDEFENPGVSLVSVTPRASDDIAPQFDIVLRVTNPNRKALDIRGMTYRIRLNGNEVIDGSATDFPKIAPLGEAEVTLNAKANLFGGLNLLSGWITGASDEIEFEFDARIDVGAFYPMVKISKRGVLAVN